jgi:hypothetical protein
LGIHIHRDLLLLLLLMRGGRLELLHWLLLLLLLLLLKWMLLCSLILLDHDLHMLLLLLLLLLLHSELFLHDLPRQLPGYNWTDIGIWASVETTMKGVQDRQPSTHLRVYLYW